MPFDGTNLPVWQRQLLGAAKIIRERGLLREMLGQPDGGPRCVYGAIEETLGLSPDMRTSEIPGPQLAYCQASKRVAAYLGATYPQLSKESARNRIWMFNDMIAEDAEHAAKVLETVAMGSTR